MSPGVFRNEAGHIGWRAVSGPRYVLSNVLATWRARRGRRGAVASEETIFRMLDLPPGRDWAWYPDLNVVGLRRGLDLDGKLRAVGELQEQWRTQHLRLVKPA